MSKQWFSIQYFEFSVLNFCNMYVVSLKWGKMLHLVKKKAKGRILADYHLIFSSFSYFLSASEASSQVHFWISSSSRLMTESDSIRVASLHAALQHHNQRCMVDKRLTSVQCFYCVTADPSHCERPGVNVGPGMASHISLSQASLTFTSQTMRYAQNPLSDTGRRVYQ